MIQSPLKESIINTCSNDTISTEDSKERSEMVEPESQETICNRSIHCLTIDNTDEMNQQSEENEDMIKRLSNDQSKEDRELSDKNLLTKSSENDKGGESKDQLDHCDKETLRIKTLEKQRLKIESPLPKEHTLNSLKWDETSSRAVIQPVELITTDDSKHMEENERIHGSKEKTIKGASSINQNMATCSERPENKKVYETEASNYEVPSNDSKKVIVSFSQGFG